MLVRESILNETYESYSELKKLTDDIFVNLIKNSKYKIDKFYNINEFVNIEDYKILRDFINAGVGLILIEKEKNDPNGSYYDKSLYHSQNEPEKLYDLFPLGFIVIYFTEKYLTEKTYLTGDFKAFHEHEINEIKNTMIHELQHAFDDYRSKGKYSPSNEILASYKTDGKWIPKKYFRTNHELSAYFVSIIDNIKFFDDNNKIKDFNTIRVSFSNMAFGMWGFLTPKIQKMYMRKLSQYYYKIKEQHEKE